MYLHLHRYQDHSRDRDPDLPYVFLATVLMKNALNTVCTPITIAVNARTSLVTIGSVVKPV